MTRTTAVALGAVSAAGLLSSTLLGLGDPVHTKIAAFLFAWLSLSGLFVVGGAWLLWRRPPSQGGVMWLIDGLILLPIFLLGLFRVLFGNQGGLDALALIFFLMIFWEKVFALAVALALLFFSPAPERRTQTETLLSLMCTTAFVVLILTIDHTSWP